MLMQVAVEDLGHLSHRMKVTLPAAEVDQEVESRLKKFAKTAKLKGFRPGKVPLSVLKKQYGDSIRYEAISELIQNTFYKALEQQHFNMVGSPSIHPTQMSEGQPLEYEATFEVYPKIELKDLSGVKVEKLKAEITEADIDKVLEKLRHQYAEWIEVERPAKLDDRVIIDFEGTMNDETFQGGSAKDAALILGSKSMIAGFEEGLVGAKVGSPVELNLQFPAEYPHKDLAGKPVKFKVTVRKVTEAKLPELNDKFAKDLDVKEGVTALREEVRKSMQRELTRGVKESIKQQVLNELLKLNTIEIPSALINAEVEQMQQQLKNQLGMQGRKLPDMPKENFMPQAKQRVTLGLLLAEFIKQQQLKADPNRVRKVIEEVVSAYDNPEQIKMHYYQNKNYLSQVEALVLEEQAVEKLLENAQVEEKTVSYDEVLKKA